MEKHFNLIEEPWIPTVDHGLVGLKEIFSNDSIELLSGSPVEKLAILKLLLAIAQSANTPANKGEWKALKKEGLAATCLAYLNKWHERFYLYGDKPFLQMPAICRAKVQPIDVLTLEVAVGNKTVLTQSQQSRHFTDADKALLIVTQMAFGLGGKKGGHDVVLSHSGLTKKVTARPAPAMPYIGQLHSFLLGSNLLETIWLNLLSADQIEQMGMFNQGVGVAPWEIMPESEDCQVATSLQNSLIGRLVPMSRFLLLSNEGVHFSEGVSHLSYLEGMSDPSASIDYSKKKPLVLWVNPEKRPWRDLTALLGFMHAADSNGFQCWQLTHSVGRAREMVDQFSVWSAGLQVTNTMGGQYISGRNDFVESVYHVNSCQLGEFWFERFTQEMSQLDQLSRVVYACVESFYKEQQAQESVRKAKAAKASHLFWQLCERKAQDLVDYCDDPERCAQLWQDFTQYAHQSYDTFSSNSTSRQMEAWARNRPMAFILKKKA